MPRGLGRGHGARGAGRCRHTRSRGPALLRAASLAQTIPDIFPPRVTIPCDSADKEPAGMPPRIEHDAGLEWLTPGGHDNSVVLTQRAGTRDTPMQVERVQLQRAQLRHQIARPLMTEPALPDPGVDEEVMELRRSHDGVLAFQGACGGMRGGRDARSFALRDAWREREEETP